MRWSEPRVVRTAIVVFVVAMAAHLAVGVTLPRNPLAVTLISDASSYDAWARRIASDGLAAEPVFHQSPLYPILLSTWYGDRQALGPPGSVWVLQAVLTSLAVATLVPIGAHYLRSRWAGVVGACIAVSFGPFVFHSFKLLPVALTLATQGAVLVLMARVRERPSRAAAAALGIACGAAVLTRAEFLPFTAVAAACAALPKVDRIRRVSSWAIGFALVIAPVTAHNFRAGDAVLVAWSGGENLFSGNQPWGDGGHSAIDPRAGDLFSARALAEQIAEHDTGRDLRPSEISRYWRNRALRAILDDPTAWIRLEIRKLARILHAGDPNDMYSVALERQRYHPGLFILVVPAGLVLFLGALGVGVAWRTRPRDAWPLLAFVGFHVATLLVFFVNARLRLPMLFGLAPFAGLAVETGVRSWNSHRRRAVVAALATAALAVGIASVALTRATPRDRVRLAAVLSSRGEFAEALDVLAPAVAEPEPDALALDQAGWVLHQSARWSEAAGYYARAVERGMPAGRETQTLTRLGQVQERLGQFDEASRSHDRAVVSPGANAGTLFERGQYRWRRGFTADARSDFERAAALDPGWEAPRDALRQLSGRP